MYTAFAEISISISIQADETLSGENNFLKRKFRMVFDSVIGKKIGKKIDFFNRHRQLDK
jgi:hypothetical protein